MGHRWIRIKMSFLWTGLLVIIFGLSIPASSVSAADQTAVVATVASDYSSGAHAVVDVDPVGGPRTIQDTLVPTISDIMVAAYGNFFYRLERYQGENVAKFDIASPDTPIYQYTLMDDGETGSANPHAMIFLNSEKAYVLRYGKTKAWIVNPSAESQSEFKIGELDLSAYADSDGIPEMENGIIVDGILYIIFQRLDRDNDWIPSNTAYMALFDTTSNEEIDTGVSNTDGVKGIPLPVKNPQAIQYLEENDTIYVQGSGDSYSYPPVYSGGIATIDPSTYATQLLLDDGDPYGSISGMAIVSAEKGYFIGYAGWGDNTLYAFSPTTGTVTGAVTSELTSINIAGMQSGAYVDENDMLWVCNQTDGQLVIINTEDDTIDEAITISLNPIMVVFAGGEAGSGSGGDDDDSTCFIDTLGFGTVD